MTAGDDLRLLAQDDPHARGLVASWHGGITDDYLQSKGVTVISVRERGKPTAAMALRHNECPIDATATWQIVYWTVDQTLSISQRRKALVASMLKAVVMGIAEGSEKGWGLVDVGDAHAHLSDFLDEVVDAGACEKQEIDANAVPVTYYIADLEKARQFMVAQ